MTSTKRVASSNHKITRRPVIQNEVEPNGSACVEGPQVKHKATQEKHCYNNESTQAMVVFRSCSCPALIAIAPSRKSSFSVSRHPPLPRKWQRRPCINNLALIPKRAEHMVHTHGSVPSPTQKVRQPLSLQAMTAATSTPGTSAETSEQKVKKSHGTQGNQVHRTYLHVQAPCFQSDHHTSVGPVSLSSCGARVGSIST